jgi:hypothetical protein
MSRNAKRIHLAAGEPRGDQTEKLDLKIETAVFFTHRVSSQAAVNAKSQSRK